MIHDIVLHSALIYLVSEWIIRVIMLVYVPQRRPPAAARSWLLFIFVFPWPGLIVYAIIGRIYLPHKRIELQQRVSELIRTQGKQYFASFLSHPDLPPQFVQAVTLAENLGDFTILSGNSVELLDDYNGTIERLTADIRAATDHVHLLYYIFADDRCGTRVVNALIEAQKRGVTCRVLIDHLGSKSWRRRLMKCLQTAGVEVMTLLPVSLVRRRGNRFDLRNHRKIAVIDGRVAYVGSQN